MILITGASRGVGAALKSLYETRGETVIGTSTAGGDGLVPLDLRRPDLGPVTEALGATPLDLLVCNAGIYADRGTRIGDGLPQSMWEEVFAINVFGVYRTIEAVLPNVRAAKGRIAVISSQMGSSERAGGGSYVYRASKAASLNLGRNLAADLAPEGIALGIYHPGYVATDMTSHRGSVQPDDSAAGLAARFDALSLDTAGEFLSYEGERLPF
ncbi:SDR family NAD(P)-dependent oxidoreductase [Wenxinia marina]|uniref:Dehydrogenase n=1 Tax=Wenxinia marina DSM 24838 TaxID=1123501 RepID=A0A0D0NLG9_9RHOB|nr:SDR family NAD(P)-dependent oxidoreductase [Wenxinia marina]KIQ69140.1 Dehydrogenase [Wenxinia marina DSM 24838]GGL70630.1 short-chain dehydrogenase [Wenxinia marina]